MVSFTNQELLTLSEVSKRLPGRPHVNTIRRWIRQGVHREEIGVIKLRSAKCGRREFVPAAALDEFLRLQNPHYGSGVEVTDSASHRAAEEKLTAMGV